jgi:hypothetical protein
MLHSYHIPVLKFRKIDMTIGEYQKEMEKEEEKKTKRGL